MKNMKIWKLMIINYFQIVMYRDGVGEGQFKLVLAHELQAIRNACLELEKDGSYTPGVTFVCVQKRHHMRLFCQERADMVRNFI